MATNDKYDRQLRLWGAAGQRALGATCVVLVRATAAGTETCKNLVLPGIGAIFVLDDCDSGDDNCEYASNFFLAQGDDPEQPRAARALKHLQELNPDVQGSWKHTEHSLLEFDFASAFQSVLSSGGTASHIQKLLVVGSDLEPPLLLKVAQVCESGQIPFIAVHSYGLIGVVRLQTPPLPLLNPKPRDAPPDLRLVHPFPALQQLADSIDWDNLENHQHGHIPYPLILLRLSKEWKACHNGMLPQTFAEKQEFQASVKAAARNFDQELNFQEAVRNAYTAYAPRELDLAHLAAIRDSVVRAEAATNNSSCHNLHILLQALEQFLQTHQQQPPVNGSIPDMTASTELYVQLQTVYRDQAAKDLQDLKSLVASLLSSSNINSNGSNNGTPALMIDDETVTAFCQNIFSVDLLQTRSIATEYNVVENDDELCEDLAMATMEGDERPEQLPLLWYLGFRACQLFFTKHGRYPGVVTGDDVEDNEEDAYTQDVAPLQSCIVEMVKAYRLEENEVVQSTLLQQQQQGGSGDDPAYATELTRYANAELHNTASVVGGVASQEAVKVITGQYVPLNNTYVYNGIASTGAVYKF